MNQRDPNPRESFRRADEARWSAWMDRANQGDSEVYRRLLEELSVAIEAYVRSRFGPADFVEVCVQESLSAIHRARATYDPKRRFRPWVLTIVHRKATDLHRRHGVRSHGRRLATDGAGDSRRESARRRRVSLPAMKARVCRALLRTRRLWLEEGLR